MFEEYDPMEESDVEEEYDPSEKNDVEVCFSLNQTEYLTPI